MRVLFVDPGTTKSAFVLFDTVKFVIFMCGKVLNELVLKIIDNDEYDMAVFEDITPQGMTGYETIETIRWLGRYDNSVTKRGKKFDYVPRTAVCKHLTGKARRGKKTDPTMDTQITAKVKERLEPNYDRHKNPGVLKGVTYDVWQAMGLAITWSDQNQNVKSAA